MDLRNVFIDNLKKLRKENGFSQMTLAAACNTSASYIGEIEIGRKFPSVEMIQKLSDALHTKPYKFFMEESDTELNYLNTKQKEELISKIQKSVEDIIKKEF